MRTPFELEFTAIPLLSLPANSLFLDIGANRGQSIDAITMMHPGARIEAFEPNPDLFQVLRRRYQYQAEINVHNLGLGDVAMEADLYVPFYKQWMFDGLASFNENEARNWLNGRIYFFTHSFVSLKKSTCRIMRLDDLALKPDFIEIDVQGYELSVLKGGLKTLIANESVLLIESPGVDIIGFLKGIVYIDYTFENGNLHPGRSGGLNTFFMAPRRFASVTLPGPVLHHS